MIVWASVLAMALSAPPSPVAVIGIVVPAEQGTVDRAAIDRAVDAAINERLTLRQISTEELFVLGSGLDQQLANCATDTACIATRLRTTRARLTFVVVVNELVQPPLVAVELVDVDVVRSVGREAAKVTAEEKNVETAIRMRAARLLDAAGHPPTGRLVVDVQPSAASVSVDGVAYDGAPPIELVLSPGSHRIAARLDGHAPADSTVACEAGRERRVVLTLQPNATVLDSPWFWTAVGVAVVSAVVVGIVVAQPGDACICAGPPNVPCDDC